jgi:predicted DsbA family dithiol-disulfide isomerase
MLDRESLLEIVDGFVAEKTAVPSERLLRALAAGAGLSAAEVRAVFEERHRAAGHETQLFDDLPFSGAG